MLRLTLALAGWALEIRFGEIADDDEDEQPDGIGAGSSNPIEGSGYGFRGADAREHDPIRVYT